MPRIKYRNRTARTQFRKLPSGGVYYLDAAGTGPSVKIGARTTLVANTYPTNTKGTAVADVSIAVKKVGEWAMGQQAI